MSESEKLPERARFDEQMLRWLRACRPECGSGSDFNQGVIRGFEIVIAQIENGHHWKHIQLPDEAATLLQSREALIGRLRDALAPFARVVDAYDYWCAEAMPDFDYPRPGVDTKWAVPERPTAVGQLDEADFRRAAKALTASRTESIDRDGVR